MKTTTYKCLNWLGKVGCIRLHDDTQYKVAKNPLQVYQQNPLIFRYIPLWQAIWPKVVSCDNLSPLE
jgi:hypothetical protein